MTTANTSSSPQPAKNPLVVAAIRLNKARAEVDTLRAERDKAREGERLADAMVDSGCALADRLEAERDEARAEVETLRAEAVLILMQRDKARETRDALTHAVLARDRREAGLEA